MKTSDCFLIWGCVLLLTSAATLCTTKFRRKRRWAVRPLNRARAEKGFFDNLLKCMIKEDTDSFFRYTRMTPNMFFYLLKLVGPKLKKDITRNPLQPAHRLLITLHYLAEGCSMQELAWGHYLGKSTISVIIRETTKILWDVLGPKYLKVPRNEEWEKIQSQFYKKWNMPNCLGAIDGKHINIQCPANTGSGYFNYKKNLGIVLMAACDAYYRFTLIDIGAEGGNHDAAVFQESGFGNAILKGKLPFPKHSRLPHSDVRLPNFFVADSAFPLHNNIMRPYPGLLLSEEKKVFNYRLSRARRTIENAFGILAARWRILRRPINAKLETCEQITQACVCLHNFIQKGEEDMPPEEKSYCPKGYADQVLADGTIVPGKWREEDLQMRSVGRVGANNYKVVDRENRDTLAVYLNSEGSVPWQIEHIMKGSVPPSFDMEF